MNKKELRKIEDKLKLHKYNKCKLSIIDIKIEGIQDEINTFGEDENLSKELIRLGKLKKELSREVNRIDSAINELPPLQKQLVELRYLDKNNWENVRLIMNMNYNYLCNVMKYDMLENISHCISI